MTTLMPEVFAPKLIHLLSNCGIALIFLPHIGGSFLHGATLQDGNGYTGALKAPVRCFGNHLSEKRKSLFQTDNKCGGAAILKNRTSRMGTPVGC